MPLVVFQLIEELLVAATLTRLDGTPYELTCLSALIKISVLVAVANEVIDWWLGCIIDVYIVCNHLSVITIVMLKELLVLEINRAEELLIRVTITSGQILQKLLLNLVTGLPHILRISSEESAAHTAAAPLVIFWCILHKAFRNIVNVAR